MSELIEYLRKLRRTLSAVLGVIAFVLFIAAIVCFAASCSNPTVKYNSTHKAKFR